MTRSVTTTTVPPEAGTLPELTDLLAAGHRVVVVQSGDELRASELVEAAAAELGLELRVASSRFASTPDHANPAWLAAALSDGGSGVQLALDCLHRFDATARRHLREHAQRRRGPALVFVELSPESLAPEVPSVIVPRPNAAEFAGHLEAWAVQSEKLSGLDLAALRQHAASLCAAAVGLERFDFLDALRLAVARSTAMASTHETPPVDVATALAAIREQKARRYAQGGVLESMAPVPLRELGGLSSFKAWLQRRALALDPRARQAAIPAPRGVMLVGVQGCGKSLAARACADVLDLPLFRLDPGRLFEGVVGGSEAKLAQTLAAVDHMAPVVLWLDEVDKGLSGSESGASDGGTSARVVGALLTWLQERERPVFVVATANDPGALPPELLRRGRLDELFFVDLPDANTRAQILEIHLTLRPARRLGEAPALADAVEDFAALARAAEGFSGAELEAALVEARLDAFGRGEALSAADLQRALEATVPLSKARKEHVDHLRRWASDRARKA